MKVVCAWCNKDIGEIGSNDVGVVSHGSCEECFAKLAMENDISSVARQVRENKTKEPVTEGVEGYYFRSSQRLGNLLTFAIRRIILSA